MEVSSSRVRLTDSESCCPIQALNDELLIEIILSVDYIRCIFRCKCVCKRWLNLINPNPLFPKSEPYFIRRYLRRRPDPAEMYVLLHSFASHPLQITTRRRINRVWFKTGFSLPCPDPSRVNILSSSNGLILCCPGTYDHGAYFICNPITRQCLSLPPPPLCSDRARLDKARVLAGFAFEGGLMLNAACRFRVVCFPARNDSSNLAVEVFSSETGRWAMRIVQRTNVAVSRPSCFETMAVCDGIAYWSERSVFTAFNLWDNDNGNSFRFFPAPCSSKDRYIGFFGQSQGFLRAVSCSFYIEDAGPSYEVYVLRDCEWFMERVIRLRELRSASNWLSQYPWRRGQETIFIAFHPQNGDIVYMRCKYYIVKCNMQSGEWRKIDKVEGGSIWDHRTAPLMLPWWPTPVPKLPK